MRYEPRLYPKLNAILASLNSSWYVSDARRARAIAAAWAFGALGEQAAPAIPELASIINCPNLDFSHRRIMAVVALNSLGRAGLPALLAAVTNQQTGFLRLSAVAHIEMLGTNAAPAVPVLQRLLMDSEPRMRVGATNALRRIDPVALEKAGARVEKVQ
jgi:HEAT repeat protein